MLPSHHNFRVPVSTHPPFASSSVPHPPLSSRFLPVVGTLVTQPADPEPVEAIPPYLIPHEVRRPAQRARLPPHPPSPPSPSSDQSPPSPPATDTAARRTTPTGAGPGGRRRSGDAVTCYRDAISRHRMCMCRFIHGYGHRTTGVPASDATAGATPPATLASPSPSSALTSPADTLWRARRRSRPTVEDSPAIPPRLTPASGAPSPSIIPPITALTSSCRPFTHRAISSSIFMLTTTIRVLPIPVLPSSVLPGITRSGITRQGITQIIF